MAIRMGTIRRATLRAALALMCATWAAAAQAQVVSNLGESSPGHTNLGVVPLLTSFHTGPANSVLTSAELQLFTTLPASGDFVTYVAQILNDASGTPAGVIASSSLNYTHGPTPSPIFIVGIETFTFAPTALTADTTYWLSMTALTNALGDAYLTYSTAETSSFGWTIGNDLNILKFALNATIDSGPDPEPPGPSIPEPGAFFLTGAAGVAIGTTLLRRRKRGEKGTTSAGIARPAATQ